MVSGKEESSKLQRKLKFGQIGGGRVAFDRGPPEPDAVVVGQAMEEPQGGPAGGRHGNDLPEGHQ